MYSLRKRLACLLLLMVMAVFPACDEGSGADDEGDFLGLTDLVEAGDSSARDLFDEMMDGAEGDETVETDLVDLDSSQDTFDVTSDLVQDPSEELREDLPEDAAMTDPVTADVPGEDGGVAEDCPDPDDPWVWYASDDPAACELIDFDCGDNNYFYDDCGCGCLAMTQCGPDLSCSIPNEYCETVYPGMPGGSTSYTCQASPEACWESPSCACITEADIFGECEEGANGSIVVSIYLP